MNRRGINTQPQVTAKTAEIIPLAERQIFKGFIGGEFFITKKGYKGSRLDTLWSKQIIEAFDEDDDELVEIALKSCLADLDLVVTGGEYGSPFNIGGFGFFAQSQFDQQGTLIIIL